MPCPHCDDTGWKPVDEHGVRRVVRCDCWREQTGRSRLVDANIPKRYLHCTLGNFTAYNESLERAVAQAKRVADEFPAVTRGLFLEGQPGVGKTHLAVAVLKQLIQTTAARGLFYDTRELLRVIRSTYDPAIRTTELQILRPVMSADLLVLDDLGAEKTSEWVDETMNLIVNTRYNEGRLTIFTSNYPDIPDDTDPNALLVPHRPPHAVPPARDVRVRRHGRRRLSRDAAATAAWTISSTCGRCARRPCRRPGASGRPARAQLRDGKGDLKWSGGRAGS